VFFQKNLDWVRRASSVPENVDFRYDPLDVTKDQIRLLRIQPLQPQDFEGPPACQLFITSLAEVDNTFSALSHTRGAPPAHFRLTINGQRFNVRESLWDFLMSFSKQIAMPTLLWIDAVCIDQNATFERNHQVALMHEIYTRARRVYVWLGQAPGLIVHDFIEAVVGESRSKHLDCGSGAGKPVLKPKHSPRHIND
jgi:hypothetical protein